MHSPPHYLHNPWLPQDPPPSQNFHVRTQSLATCLDILRPSHTTAKAPLSAAPCLLIQGSWGSGKTMLAGALAEGLSQQTNLYPVLLPQDTPHVLNLAQLFTQVLSFMLPAHDPALNSVIGETYAGAQRGKALDLLEKMCRARKTTLVLVVDNIDVLLIQQLPEQDAKILGQVLTYESWLSIAGTMDVSNASRFPAVLRDYFSNHLLPPLQEQEITQLWERFTGNQPSPLVMLMCKCLCQGNPRLMGFLAVSYLQKGDANPMSAFFSAIDSHTPYYKAHLQELPAVERKVFATLADQWTPSTAREIAKMADMDVNKASSLLNRLVKRGKVHVFHQRGRVKHYELEGPFHNLNYLVRTGQDQLRQVTSLCLFMEAFCLENAENGDAPPEHLPDKHGPIPDFPAQAAPLSPLSAPGIQASPPQDKNTPDYTPSPSSPAPNPTDAPGWNDLAKTLESEGLYEDAVQAYTKSLSIKPDHAWAWGRLAHLLHTRLHLYEDAENAYLQAIEKDPNQAWIWSGLGQLLQENLRNYVEAEQAYRIAIELAPRSADHRVSMGRLHEKLERHQSALRTYREAARIEPENPLSLQALGQLLESQGKIPEAQQAYTSAAECRPNDSQGWTRIGQILQNKLAKPQKAMAAYQKALDIAPNHYPACEGLIRLEALDLDHPENALALARSYLESVGFGPVHCQKLCDTFSSNELRPLLPEIQALCDTPLPGNSVPRSRTMPGTAPWKNLTQEPMNPAPVPRPTEPPPPYPESGFSQPEQQKTGPDPKELEIVLQSLPPDAEPDRRTLAGIIGKAMALTVHGMGPQVSDLLTQHSKHYYIVPLWAGIQKYLGKEARAGAETRLLAQEVVERIRHLKKP